MDIHVYISFVCVSVCVCMYVCMHVRMYLCMYICVCTYMYTYIYIFIRIYVYIYIRIYTCMCIYMYVCVCIMVCMYASMCMYTNTQTYVHIHAYFPGTTSTGSVFPCAVEQDSELQRLLAGCTDHWKLQFKDRKMTHWDARHWMSNMSSMLATPKGTPTSNLFGILL